MDESALAIMVPITLFLGLFTFLAVGAYYKYKKNQDRQETIRQAIEKGVATDELIQSLDPKSDPKIRNDLRRGIRWCAVGAGVGLFALIQGDLDIVGIAAIPFAIGVGYLISSRFSQDSNGKKSNNVPHEAE